MCFKRVFYFIQVGVAVMLLSASCSGASSTPTPASIATQKVPISVNYPDLPVSLSLLSNVPGMMRLAGYSGSEFVSGTIEISNPDWTPQIEKEDHKVALVQKARTQVDASPGFQNLWKLLVSDSVPFQLEIDNGRAEGHWNFSGLPITRLKVKTGLAKNAFTFDQLNPIIMDTLEINCGTGEVILEGVLNSACKDIVIRTGDGGLTLRWGGKEVSQDLRVKIYSGKGPINIAVSPEIPVRITVPLSATVIQGQGVVKTGSNDMQKTYATPSYQETDGKKIEISISGDRANISLNPS
jgi:hypothetical protein